MGLGYVLYTQVFFNIDVKESLSTLRVNLLEGRGWFVMALVLTVFNWSVETVKWRFLVNKISAIGYSKAFLGVLLGIAFSLFTPNRLGEYGGRVLVLKHHRIAAIVSTLIGSYSQIVVNMSLGGLACFIFLWKYFGLDSYLLLTAGVIYVGMLVFLLLTYFNIDLTSDILGRYSIFNRVTKYINVVKIYPSKDLRKLLFLSSIRYVTYCMQFILLLKVFKAGVKFCDGVVLIPNVFFVQGFLPTMAIFDLSLRGEVAITIISQFASGEHFQVVAASIVLWFINLIVPSLIGGVLALFFKFRA